MGHAAVPEAAGPKTPSALWYRFGDGFLGLCSEDSGFRDRFHDLYRGCVTAPPAATTTPTVRCVVRLDPSRGRVHASYDDPEPLDPVDFATTALADLGYREVPSTSPERRTIASDTHPGVLHFENDTIVADTASPWKSIAGPLAVHRVFRLQRHVLFLHAASVSVGGRGLILVGPKEAGKTTISLALAESGHSFLGDEIAAVRTRTLELLPFRRRLSVRPGPAAAGVARRIRLRSDPLLQLPDGTVRSLMHADSMLPPDEPVPTTARAIVFLRNKGAIPQLEAFTASRRELGQLAPFESVAWAEDRALVAVRVLALLGRLPCYYLDLGSIPETVRVLETLMEEGCR